MPNRPETVQHIGKSFEIKGELIVDQDLAIEGHVEGIIQLGDHVLTVGPNGRVNARVFAKSVIVFGEVVGNITATDRIDVRDHASLDGDVFSPRVRIAEGAHFRGFVEMPPSARATASSNDEIDPIEWFPREETTLEADLPAAR